jgi:predicted nucleic acid-binding protein
VPFFVDANIIVYSATAGPYGDACRAILKPISDGDADGVTSVAVLEEVWRVELSGKAGDVSGLARDAHALFTPLLPVTDETFAQALTLRAEGLGANDRLHVATCLENAIDAIVTADAAFDRVPGLRRIDPLDGRAVARLLERS